MRKLLLLIFCLILSAPAYSWSFSNPLCGTDECAIKNLLNSQVRYANRTNFTKFMSTYDNKYVNGDGFDYNQYSELVKDIWSSFRNIKYGIEIESIKVDGDCAEVKLKESSYAKISMSKVYQGELKSLSDSIYYLEKKNNKWKVVGDDVLDETTSMLYGDAKDLDIKLTVPNKIDEGQEYTATLEFTPPEETIAIASLAADKVEYPQKQTQEVYRALPEDNILERLFTSNSENANEYVVASIGLTQASTCDLNVKLKLTGFGYAIRRVNVIHKPNNEGIVEPNDKEK